MISPLLARAGSSAQAIYGGICRPMSKSDPEETMPFLLTKFDPEPVRSMPVAYGNVSRARELSIKADPATEVFALTILACQLVRL
jgi:hypothetical protein